MSKVIRLQNRRNTLEAIHDQAGIYLAQLERGATDAEREAIEAWLREDPRHRETFLHMARLWDEMSLLSGLSEAFPLAGHRAIDGTRRLRRVASAACLVLVAGLVLWAWQDGLPGWPTSSIEVAHAKQYETAVGEQSRVTLPDGSRVLLNTATLIGVDYTAALRNVVLGRGEAYFMVEPGSDRPFRVYAGDQLMEVVGTAFTVRRIEGEGMEVMVREGRVDLNRIRRSEPFPAVPEDIEPLLPAQGLSLTTGDMAIAGDSREEWDTTGLGPEAVTNRLAWTRGQLIFTGEPLARVLTEMTRYTHTILDADTAILDLPVEGTFRVGDIEGLLAAMREEYNIKGTRVGSEYLRLHLAEEG